MNLKYKKAILLIIISTMGIGVLTLSVAPRNNANKDNIANTESISNKDKPASSDNTKKAIEAPKAASALTGEPTLTPAPTATEVPTVPPTPTQLPIYPLEDSGYPKIEALMKDYYDAKYYCDVDKLKTIYSNPADVPSKEKLEEDVYFIEEYQNLKCYVKKSYEEDSYIVFVYYEVKFINIKTSAPAVGMFYIIPNNAGGYKKFSGELDENLKDYCEARKQDADVQELIQETEAKCEEAKAKDEFFKTFWEQLQTTQKTTD